MPPFRSPTNSFIAMASSLVTLADGLQYDKKKTVANLKKGVLAGEDPLCDCAHGDLVALLGADYECILQEWKEAAAKKSAAPKRKRSASPKKKVSAKKAKKASPAKKAKKASAKKAKKASVTKKRKSSVKKTSASKPKAVGKAELARGKRDEIVQHLVSDLGHCAEEVCDLSMTELLKLVTKPQLAEWFC